MPTTYWPKVKTPKKIKPLGNTSPYVWCIEPAFGCNLKCGHCCAELIPEDQKGLMTYETWCNTFKIINEVSPTVRVDIAGVVGEPTLNPHLVEWLPEARRLAPHVQIQITTNGTKLLSGEYKYRDLLKAGANIIYTDQYGKNEIFDKLAEESNYPHYQYYSAPEGAWSPWTYHGPQIKMIVLMDPPYKWPKSRLNANLLGNWLGNLNWKKGKRYGMKPLEEPIKRRCNQPFINVTVSARGEYLLCCQDGMHMTEGWFGNVSEGREGFLNFWYGKKLQSFRRTLRNKIRSGICAKCNITFSRSDYILWKDEQMDRYMKDGKWENFKKQYIPLK